MNKISPVSAIGNTDRRRFGVTKRSLQDTDGGSEPLKRRREPMVIIIYS